MWVQKRIVYGCIWALMKNVCSYRHPDKILLFFFLLLFCVFLLIPSLKKKLLDNYSLTLVSLRKKNYRFKGIKNGKIIWYKEFTGIFESTVFFPRKRSNTRVYQLGCKELAIFSTLLSRGPLIFFSWTLRFRFAVFQPILTFKRDFSKRHFTPLWLCICVSTGFLPLRIRPSFIVTWYV